MMPADATRLRELAAWYRNQAERAGDPRIWDSRLRTAIDLDDEADAIERGSRSGAHVGSRVMAVSDRAPNHAVK